MRCKSFIYCHKVSLFVNLVSIIDFLNKIVRKIEPKINHEVKKPTLDGRVTFSRQIIMIIEDI